MGVNSLPKTVTQQHCGRNLNSGPSVSESSMLTTRLLLQLQTDNLGFDNYVTKTIHK